MMEVLLCMCTTTNWLPASSQLAAMQLSTAELPARPITAGYTMWPGNCCVDGVKWLKESRALQAKRRLLVRLRFFFFNSIISIKSCVLAADLCNAVCLMRRLIWVLTCNNMTTWSAGRKCVFLQPDSCRLHICRSFT